MMRLTKMNYNDTHKLSWLNRLSILLVVSLSGITVHADGIPLSAVELSNEINVEVSGFRLDRRTGEILQAVKVINISPTVISGRIYLLVEDMADQVSINSDQGPSTISVSAGGSDHSIGLFPAGQTTLAPGAQVSTILRIDKPAGRSVNYLPRVYVEADGS